MLLLQHVQRLQQLAGWHIVLCWGMSWQVVTVEATLAAVPDNSCIAVLPLLTLRSACPQAEPGRAAGRGLARGHLGRGTRSQEQGQPDVRGRQAPPHATPIRPHRHSHGGVPPAHACMQCFHTPSAFARLAQWALVLAPACLEVPHSRGYSCTQRVTT